MNATAPDFDIFPTIAPKKPTQPARRLIAENVPSFNPPVERPLPRVPTVVSAEPVPPVQTMPEPVADPLPEIPARDRRMLATERTLFASLPARARRHHEIHPPARSAFTLRDEEGGALVMVIVLMVAVGLIVSAIFFNLQAGITQTSMAKSSIIARSAAESGHDVGLWSAIQRECDAEGAYEEVGYSFELYRSNFLVQPPTATNSYGVSAGCPEDGDYFLVVKSVGTDTHGYATKVLSIYEWGDGTEETAFDADATQRAMPTLMTRLES